MNKTERLQIRISPEMKEQLQKAAKADGRSVSNFVEKIIKEALNKQ